MLLQKSRLSEKEYFGQALIALRFQVHHQFKTNAKQQSLCGNIKCKKKSFAKNEILLDFFALIIYNYKSEK